MPASPRVFLDTSVLFAAIHSERGGARAILMLGEAGVIDLWIGPWVLRELEGVLNRKSPRSKPYLALLLDRARVQVGPEAGAEALVMARTAVDYLPDAQILAEAIEARAGYFVSLDRTHLVGNPQVARLPFPVGTPGDFLAWYRARITAL